MTFRPLKGLLLWAILALLLPSPGLGAEWPIRIAGQPTQMWSTVDYDPKLSDPFFLSNEWSYPWNIVKHPDGHFEDTSSFRRSEIEPPHLKHTAKCFVTASGYGRDHDLVSFCEARLRDGKLVDLLIHEDNAAYDDRLAVRIKHGRFTCQYGTSYKWLRGHLTWTTKRQKLTLDKKTYRKGDLIKGRIDFECLEEEDIERKGIKNADRKPQPYRLYGVFKTIVK